MNQITVTGKLHYTQICRATCHCLKLTGPTEYYEYLYSNRDVSIPEYSFTTLQPPFSTPTQLDKVKMYRELNAVVDVVSLPPLLNLPYSTSPPKITMKNHGE